MPLRLLEVTLPPEAAQEIPDLLEGAPVVHCRLTQNADHTSQAGILLDTQNTEAVSDLLVSKFGTREGFRLVLLSVEATLPAVEPPEAPQGPAAEPEPVGVGPRRISREELYEDVSQAGRLTKTFAIMVALSTVVAAVGIIRGDVAIVIGAMVIAPLLGPNVALSLAAALGDLDLARRSMKAIAVGVGVAALLSLVLGAVLRVDPLMPAVAARTQPDIADVVLALAAGAAGSLAFTSGVPAIVVGVMVAVALLPPLVVLGLLTGAGHWGPAGGAALLVLTNVTCINLAAVATFFVQRVQPRTWWEASRARKATRLAATAWLVLLGMLLALIILERVRGV